MALTHPAKSFSVLIVSTFAFTTCFMVWMMFGVIGVPVASELGLNGTEFGLLAATPVLTGSLIRVPLGMWTDRHGGRIVMFVLLLACVVPLWLVSYATEFWQFLVLGLFVGAAGGAFSVGTPYVARWFDRKHQGFAMGIYGAGNAGAAVNKFIAPAIILAAGWMAVPKVYAAIMLGTAIVFWFGSHREETPAAGGQVTWREQLAALRDPRVWKYSQYYSIVFGGYVGLALWMTQYYVAEYELTLQTAALLAAFFSLPGGVLRAFGGWLSDRWGAHKVTWWVLWVSWICLFLLSYPQTEMTIRTATGPKTFSIGLEVWMVAALTFVVGIAWAFGKASVFKYISDEFHHNIGVVSGVVGLAGGLAGFLLPIMFGVLVDLTGIRSSCFMLMYGIVWVSLIWIYWTEVRRVEVLGPRARAFGLRS